jgi:hypothetical protein
VIAIDADHLLRASSFMDLNHASLPKIVYLIVVTHTDSLVVGITFGRVYVYKIGQVLEAVNLTRLPELPYQSRHRLSSFNVTQRSDKASMALLSVIPGHDK